jgi:large subunit ribosomal protein L6
MSRIGKNPVAVPDKVQVKLEGLFFSAKGPKGELSYTFNSLVDIKQAGNEITVTPANESQQARALWGTTRTLISNMVHGVSEGFTKSLEFNGVGYKAAVAGNVVTLNLGYSHPIEYTLPAGIEVKVNRNQIDVHGSDKELVGFVAAKIRSFRPPEPYKGKGVKYMDETIIRKAGKSGGK